MCTCTHGSDRHYLDYAGPGICGGILTRCLEEGCGCKLFTAIAAPGVNVQIVPGNIWVNGRWSNSSIYG